MFIMRLVKCEHQGLPLSPERGSWGFVNLQRLAIFITLTQNLDFPSAIVALGLAGTEVALSLLDTSLRIQLALRSHGCI